MDSSSALGSCQVMADCLNHFLPSPLQIATAGFVTEEKAKEVEQFFKDNPCPMAERVVRQNCEAIRVNAKWLQRDTEAVKEWLSTQ